jgi:hypothetical protein
MIIKLKTIVPDGLSCPEGKRREELVDTGGTGLYSKCRAYTHVYAYSCD